MRKITALTAGTALATAFAGTPAPTTDKPATTKAKTGPKPGAERVAPIISAVTADVAMPANVSRAGSKSAYPFDALTTAGMSFHVANKTAKQMSSIVSNQNRKNAVQKTDANGSPMFKTNEMKDANGAVIGTTQGDPIMERTTEFKAVDVGADDPSGAGVRVFRVK